MTDEIDAEAETKSGIARMPLYVTSINDADALVAAMDARLASVEGAMHIVETERAVNEEKEKFMVSRFNALDGRLDRIDGHIAKLVWLILAAIIGGFMSLVIRGGLLGL
ncbi:MAG: hypothetical protein AAFQ54_00960 [Pseudomonadota bacterium]